MLRAVSATCAVVLASLAANAAGPPPEVVLLGSDSSLGGERHWREMKNCGVCSSYLLCRLHGIEVNYDQLRAEVPVTEWGSSLYDMKYACRRHGLDDAEVLRLGPKDLDDTLPPF